MNQKRQRAAYLATKAAAEHAGGTDPEPEAFGLTPAVAENTERLGAQMGGLSPQLWPPVVFVLCVDGTFVKPDSLLDPYTEDVTEARFWATESEAEAYVEEMGLTEPTVEQVDPAAHA